MANFPHKEEVIALEESGFRHPRYSAHMGRMTYLKSGKHKAFMAYRVRDIIKTYKQVGKDMGKELVQVTKSSSGASRTVVEIPLNMTEGHVLEVVYEPANRWRRATRGKAPFGVLFVKSYHIDTEYPTSNKPEPPAPPVNDDPPPPVDESLVDAAKAQGKEEVDPEARDALRAFLDAYANGADPKELEKKRVNALTVGGVTPPHRSVKIR
jgi:hypothetical protein